MKLFSALLRISIAQFTCATVVFKPGMSDFSDSFPGLLPGISVVFRSEATLICYSISMAFIFVVILSSL